MSDRMIRIHKNRGPQYVFNDGASVLQMYWNGDQSWCVEVDSEHKVKVIDDYREALEFYQGRLAAILEQEA